jgi:hypothetical protein
MAHTGSGEQGRSSVSSDMVDVGIAYFVEKLRQLQVAFLRSYV